MKDSPPASEFQSFQQFGGFQMLPITLDHNRESMRVIQKGVGEAPEQ